VCGGVSNATRRGVALGQRVLAPGSGPAPDLGAWAPGHPDRGGAAFAEVRATLRVPRRGEPGCENARVAPIEERSEAQAESIMWILQLAREMMP